MRVIPKFNSPTRRMESHGAAWILERDVPIDLPDEVAAILIEQGTAWVETKPTANDLKKKEPKPEPPTTGDAA